MSMNIEWERHEIVFRKLEGIFLSLGKEAIKYNHYDLADTPESREQNITSDQWQSFITDGRVAKYISDEFKLIEQSELRKMVTGISTSRSVGQAQLISAMSKRDESNKVTKEGPAFVYCYIPLTEQQQHVTNAVMLDYDPFLNTGDRAAAAARLIVQALGLVNLIPDVTLLATMQGNIESILNIVYPEDTAETEAAEVEPVANT